MAKLTPWKRATGGRWLRGLKCRAVLSVLIVAVVGCSSSPTGPGHDFGTNDPNVYVAFGNSITAGQGDTGTGLSCPTRGSAFGYPPRLAAFLGATVINEGICGTKSEDGVARVGRVLARHRPGHLLILYSPNDIHTPTSTIISNLRFIIMSAKANSTIPIIGTLTPTFDSHGRWMPFIRFINSRIRGLAAEEGIEVADHFTAFNLDRGLINSDGLHPNSRGYDQMARTWYAAI